jgi:tetratricopeptide (TPR) repeat protein
MSPSTPLRIFALLVLVVSALAARADELTDVQRLQAAGQTDAALKKADEFLATKPKDAAMRFLKGVILTDGKRSTEAIEIFRGLTEDYPELPEPYNNLATLYAAKGDYDAARSALEEALRANPDFAMAHENLGDVYATLANRTYARARQLEPNNTSVPAKLALLRQLLALSQPAAAAAGSAASAAAR